MKKVIFAAVTLIVLVGLQGCYTQLVVRESRPYRTAETPEYSETYTDSSGAVITDNYYYDDSPRSNAYFSYYYPIRHSYMWPTYYDPFWDWGYSPWSWGYSPWYSGYYSPWYYGSYYGGSSWYMHYPYHHHHGYWDRYPVYTYNSSSPGRTRSGGVTRTPDGRVRDYGVTRGGFTGGGGTTGPSSIRSRSPETRSSDAVDRISVRSRDRSTAVPQGNYTPPAGTRTRTQQNTTPGSDVRTRSRDNSGSSERAAPQGDTRSRERSGSSYSPPERSYSPPSNSGSGSSSSGGSRSRDGGSSSGGSSSGGSSSGGSSGGGRSRGR